MKREIKFRGKRLDQNKWLHGDLIHINGEPLISDPTANIGFNRAFVNPDSVGQFTGLKDRNGTEIYEDDFIRYVYDCRNWGGFRPLLVEFFDGNFMVHDIDKTEYSTLNRYVAGSETVYEVIGNIHDNPDLIDADE